MKSWIANFFSDKSDVAAVIGTLGLWIVTGWELLHGKDIALEHFAASHALIWGAHGLTKIGLNWVGGDNEGQQ